MVHENEKLRFRFVLCVTRLTSESIVKPDIDQYIIVSIDL